MKKKSSRFKAARKQLVFWIVLSGVACLPTEAHLECMTRFVSRM